jgi:hypothetical protein
MNFGNQELFIIYWFVWYIAVAVINITFALCVFWDAESFANSGRKVVLVPSQIWCLATLIGGVFVAATYWLIHHSTLNPNNLVSKKITDEFE